jgi:hypothetical protein
MTDAKAKWTEVGNQLNELGLKLKLHLEQAAPEDGREDADKVREALTTLSAAVEQAFGALGTAARDDAVRTDVKDAGRAVVDALDATFAELAERVRTR